MYWTLLILGNLPVYFFFAWLIFDNAENATQSFLTTLLLILKAIFVPRILRVLLDMEDDGGFEAFELIGFLIACIGTVWGEHYLLTNYVFN